MFKNNYLLIIILVLFLCFNHLFSQNNFYKSKTDQSTLQSDSIFIAIPIQSAVAGDTINIPVEVSFPSDSLYYSTEINISGFQNSIDFLSIRTDNSLVGNAGWIIQINDTDSLLMIATAGSNAINGSGTLFWLEFSIPDSADTGFVPIIIDSATFNTGNLMPIISSGGIDIITMLMYGDVDLDGVVWYDDCDTLMNYLVNKTSLNPVQMLVANVTPDTTVSSFDAFYIFQYVNQWIPSLPVNTNYPASADFSAQNYNISAGDIVDVTFSYSNNLDMGSFWGEIEYPVSGLTLLDVIWSPVILDTFRLEYNSNLPNKILFAGYSWGSSPISSDLITLRFQVDNNYNSDSAFVVLSKVRLNESPVLQNAAVSTLYLITEISGEKDIIPKEFSLNQNYPNPFNPVTTIRYSIPRFTNVSLKIYNIEGKEIETLVNEKQSVGSYNVKWNGMNKSGEMCTSGTYFLHFETDESTQIKKMILVR